MSHNKYITETPDFQFYIRIYFILNIYLWSKCTCLLDTFFHPNGLKKGTLIIVVMIHANSSLTNNTSIL